MSKALPISPLAVPFPEIGVVKGVEFATARAGFYKHDRPDVVLMHFPQGATAAGVFTRHKVGSAPVDWCAAALKATGGEGVRAVVINAGCANSFTGEAGAQAAAATAAGAAAELGCTDAEVLLASTGVIGVLLKHGNILNVLQPLIESLAPDAWAAAGQGITTTDTFPKGAVRTAAIDGVPVKVAGIAKGSGMIAPNMATMLAFVATDATLSPAVLQGLLKRSDPAHLQRRHRGRRPLHQRHLPPLRHRGRRRSPDHRYRRPTLAEPSRGCRGGAPRPRPFSSCGTAKARRSS